jgi:hypothetical protein
MRRRIENESRKLKSSSSNERTSHLTSKFLNWKSEKRFDLKSPKRRNLISAEEVNDSFDTCIFPCESRDECRVSCGIQTDPAPCYLESLVLENQSLAGQVKELKLEIETLKSLVKDLAKCKKLAKFQVNQEIIEMLENENKIIKRCLEPN